MQMNGVSVFELEPGSFALTRQISAARALWSPSLTAVVDLRGRLELRLQGWLRQE